MDIQTEQLCGSFFSLRALPFQNQGFIVLPEQRGSVQGIGHLSCLFSIIEPDRRMIRILFQIAFRHIKAEVLSIRAVVQTARNPVFCNIADFNRFHTCAFISLTRKVIAIVLASWIFPCTIRAVISSRVILDTLRYSSGSRCWPRYSPLRQ